MGPLPDHVKGKRSATAETLSEVGIHTYVDPLPVDRTRKPFSRLGADLPNSTWNDDCVHVAKDLKPRYEQHRQDSEYIQADETRIPVRDPVKSKTSGKNHLGYDCLYSAPMVGFVEYPRGRSRDGPLKILNGFQGKLQMEAYRVSDELDPFHCVTHCRRTFEQGKTSEYAFVQENGKVV